MADPKLTVMGVPARIKLPGGRLRKMPWKTLDGKKNVKPQPTAVEPQKIIV